VDVSSETNVDLLRKKARVLESENVRLSNKIALVLRENLELKGMAPDQIALNLPALCAQAAGSDKANDKGASTTKPGNERRADAPERKPKDNKPQTGHGPTPQPLLPVDEKTLFLDEADRICPDCGGNLEEWKGQCNELEEVTVIERSWVLTKYECQTYRCGCGCIESAEGPEKLIPGGRYSPEVALTAAEDKYLDHTPLERQVRIARRQGALLTSQALWDQVYALATLLKPLHQRIHDFILTQPVVGMDESPFKLIQKGGSAKWQAWELSCPYAIFFSILASKSAAMAETLLKGFAGILLVDGAPAYTSAKAQLGFIIANCWSHARRKVLAADGEAPAQVKAFVDLVGRLYAIDRQAVRDPSQTGPPGGYRQQIDMDRLRELRDTESRVVVAELQSWILEQKCTPGGLLKTGLDYVARRWTPLTLFLDDPAIPLDNNRTEGGYIGLALGRRNYIGARSVRGTEVAGVFYTVFESAKLCGLNPQEYLRYAAYGLLRQQPVLLPHEWAEAGHELPRNRDG